MLTLPAFFYPTTIISIDDDRLFLNAISQDFISNHAVKTFNNPETCLSFFESYALPDTHISFLHNCNDHDHFDTTNHLLVDLNIPSLHTLISIPERHQEVSVIIVDYSMPKINGIELCRKLKTLPFKKILLTGKADHHAAISAFNENIIDRFIPKDSPTIVDDFQNYIKSLTQQYFQERTSALLSNLENNRSTALSDPEFIEFFDSWCDRNEIKEYFLIDKNGSYLAVNHNNHLIYFIMHTEHTLNSFIKLNDDVNEIDKFIIAIKERKQIPFFGIGKESWQFETQLWLQYFYPAQLIEGREKYFYCVIN